MTDWTSSAGVVRLPFFGRGGSVESGPLTNLGFRPSWLLHETSTDVHDLPNVGACFTASLKSEEISIILESSAMNGAILIAWYPNFLAPFQVRHHARTGSLGGLTACHQGDGLSLLKSTGLVIQIIMRMAGRFHPKTELTDSPSSLATKIAPRWGLDNFHNIGSDEENSTCICSALFRRSESSLFSRSERARTSTGSPYRGIVSRYYTNDQFHVHPTYLFGHPFNSLDAAYMKGPRSGILPHCAPHRTVNQQAIS